MKLYIIILLALFINMIAVFGKDLAEEYYSKPSTATIAPKQKGKEHMFSVLFSPPSSSLFNASGMMSSTSTSTPTKTSAVDNAAIVHDASFHGWILVSLIGLAVLAVI